MAPSTTENGKWSTDFDTVRRHNLFRNPPSDKSAYPTLASAVDPHVQSFNAVFAEKGQLY
ncbi:hypothetical protein KCV04_g23288, partial [Aureobasidium melanogenum]